MKLSTNEINALNNCLKCSICVDSCPVTKVNPKFPGPKQLGVDWLRIAQEDGEEPSEFLDYCSNCKMCETVCPSGVHVATLNQLAKTLLPKKRLGLREKIFSDPARLGKLIHIWPQAGNVVTNLPSVKLLTEKAVGISAQACMPRYSTKTFQKQFTQYKPEFTQKPKEVLYYPGCFTQYNGPESGISVVKILTKLNYKVIVPEFKCCGQPAISNGHLEETKNKAEYNLSLLKRYHQTGMPILFTCPSCLLTFKDEYQNLLGMNEYAHFTPSMIDAGQFLNDHKKQLATLIAKRDRQNLKMAYHEPCHLKASGQGTPSLSLLNEIGLKITSLDSGCCGQSGSYGLKTEKQWIAQEIGNEVKDALAKLKAQTVVTECGMCSVQINHLSKLPVYHPLQLLAELV